MVTKKAPAHQNFAKKTTDMRIFVTCAIVIIAATLLVSSGAVIDKIELQLHHNTFINGLAKYQLYALMVGLVTMALFLLINPESKQLLGLGKLSTIAAKERWLGVNGKTTWLKNGLQLLLFISMATGVFMFLGVKYTNSLNNFQWWFVPLVLLFSLTNSFTEEIIFRYGIIAGLDKQYAKLVILIVSAVLFGLPHYFGNPSGVTGVVMSGVLGYILCKATIETKGISMSWFIHFVQDVIIFTAMMMMNIKQ